METVHTIISGGKRYPVEDVETSEALAREAESSQAAIAQNESKINDVEKSVNALFEDDSRIVATLTHDGAMELIQGKGLKIGGVYKLFLPMMPLGGHTGVSTDLSDPEGKTYYYLFLLATDVDRFDDKAVGCLYYRDGELVEESKAWQIWYDIENDTSKYDWADAENGRGVIYRMIDGFGNEAPYDFANISFYDVAFERADEIPEEARPKTGRYYTFCAADDQGRATSVVGRSHTYCYGNVIKAYIDEISGKMCLRKNILMDSSSTVVESDADGNIILTAKDSYIGRGCRNNYILTYFSRVCLGLGTYNCTFAIGVGSLGNQCSNITVRNSTIHAGNQCSNIEIENVKKFVAGDWCRDIAFKLGENYDYAVNIGREVKNLNLMTYSASPLKCTIEVGSFISDYTSAIELMPEGATLHINRNANGEIVKYIGAGLDDYYTKKEVNAEITKEKDRAKEAENALDEKIEANKKLASELYAKVLELERKLEELINNGGGEDVEELIKAYVDGFNATLEGKGVTLDGENLILEGVTVDGDNLIIT